ncbi:hypothetical protein [Herbidospora mongoliensis]|uniref:hypothetical protein n=1 Tax=Herbidospora mongoliensis TaxID=688067 RepID=UPI0008339D1E|nr:hypothetical protein [Herbidospora mongoliensis]
MKNATRSHMLKLTATAAIALAGTAFGATLVAAPSAAETSAPAPSPSPSPSPTGSYANTPWG